MKDTKRRCIKRIVSLFVSVVMVLSMSTVVFAISEEEAMQNLTSNVHDAISDNKYTLDGGGSTTGSTIMVQESDGSKTYTIDEDAYDGLTSSSQTSFVEDVVEASNDQIGKRGVTQDTVQIWFKDLQQKDGVGSKFMNVILKNTKPDFVTANAIYEPFSGIVGTLLGLGAVLIMALLGLVIVADIAYIALPPVRMFSEGGSNGAKKDGLRSHLFSNDAIKAVEIAENSPNDSPKQALGIYFKRRVVMLIILGICLLYLVQGQIYTLVGWILDLVSGFLKF